MDSRNGRLTEVIGAVWINETFHPSQVDFKQPACRQIVRSLVYCSAPTRCILCEERARRLESFLGGSSKATTDVGFPRARGGEEWVFSKQIAAEAEAVTF